MRKSITIKKITLRPHIIMTDTEPESANIKLSRATTQNKDATRKPTKLTA
ncbi:hypothetical protein TUM3792_41450 [Shewanella sp. MBTL60-007]|nr:hypothetical protein TUM3792_41450 [Shewanella sp. MBTL60-007]